MAMAQMAAVAPCSFRWNMRPAARTSPPRTMRFGLSKPFSFSQKAELCEFLPQVVFVHPMYATSAERAVAYEAQAIARCRRYGQQKPEAPCNLQLKLK